MNSDIAAYEWKKINQFISKRKDKPGRSFLLHNANDASNNNLKAKTYKAQRLFISKEIVWYCVSNVSATSFLVKNFSITNHSVSSG